MSEKDCGCGSDETKACDAATEDVSAAPKGEEAGKIIDEKVRLLIAAGAAMAANCVPCLESIVPSLKAAGVGARDIRAAVGIGQFVKDKPAEVMKALADELTGSHLLKKPLNVSCPGKIEAVS